jgi:chitinase
MPSDKIITHAPQAPYFCTNKTIDARYPKGAYLAVHAAVGDMINFYNIQFYNQGFTMYENAQDLFNISSGWAPGTSINEIIASGVPSSKVVLGKPATGGDANNGLMTAAAIDAAIAANYPYNQWKAGVMFWQYSSDSTGAICNEATKSLMSFAAQAQ